MVGFLSRGLPAATAGVSANAGNEPINWGRVDVLPIVAASGSKVLQ